VEKVFLAACVFYVAYPISCFLAHPKWSDAVISTLKPSFQFSAGYFYMLTGVVGTTIAPWMQFYLQSAVVEKGIKVKEYIYSRWDVIVGCIITDVVAFFIIVACAATIYISGNRQINDAGDAAVALAPLAGDSAMPPFSRLVFCRWRPLITSAKGWAWKRALTSAFVKRRPSTGSIPR
jgi:Mn2+/Fe2+ NRAMP family transporter